MDIIYNNESGLAVREKINANFQEHADKIEAIKGSLLPQGNWNATSNTPDISLETETGYYWIVSVGGTTDLGGITDWKNNDWAVKTATGWAKIDNSELITSVAGKTGNVTLEKADVGLGNVDNTSDVNKPISTLMQSALNNKLNAAYDSIGDILNQEGALSGTITFKDFDSYVHTISIEYGIIKSWTKI